jgi:hypothetical protein
MMKRSSSYLTAFIAHLLCLVFVAAPLPVSAQTDVVVLTGAQLARIVPSGFYFEGQSAPTQMRNSAASRLGAKHHIVAGLVDTSGYSADVRARYEGFLIVDAPIQLGGQELTTGAYGFGFTDDGKLNVFDVGGRQVLSVDAENDTKLRRPRPLMMMRDQSGVRLYGGRRYVVAAVR